jgi:hypothetical protein
MFVSSHRSPWQAKSRAIKLLEQAESRVMLGPVRSKNQLIRLANMLSEAPLALYFGLRSRSWDRSSL